MRHFSIFEPNAYPSFETALAPEEIPWRIGGNSSPLFPLVVFILPSDDQRGLNERGEGRALTPLRPMVKYYSPSPFRRNPRNLRFSINDFLVPNQPPKRLLGGRTTSGSTRSKPALVVEVFLEGNTCIKTAFYKNSKLKV